MPTADPALVAHFTETAASHRRLVVHADTDTERRHWIAEAARFDNLADLARTDAAAARRAYLPTRSYEPEEG